MFKSVVKLHKILKALLQLVAAMGWGLLASAAVAAPKAPPQHLPGALQVPAPDWRDQILYFAFTDRFDDGDTRNNDFGQGEFDPKRGSHHSGGDLKGLQRRLGYIQGLGATALWITPPVANRWWDGTRTSTGHHGYWAEHFMRVDAHLGGMQDMQALARGLHGRGMYLVQDIVLNHMGDYFYYRSPWNPAAPGQNHVLNVPDRGRTAPTQPPFNLNDATKPAHVKAGIYHFTPDIADYEDPRQEANFQMSGLDDLNSEHPRVRRALRQSYAHWLRRAGVDAFRVDTAFYMPPDALADFMFARDPRAPGMRAVGRALGKPNLFVFGEGFGVDKPFEDTKARKIEAYMHTATGQPVLPAMLNFPLYGAFSQVFANGQPTAVLGHRIASMMALHPRVHWMPTFVDNHDVDRFLKGGSEPALRQALLAMMTLPGIPVLYYGTEQGFTEPRASMFAAGWGSQRRDHFNPQAPLYRFIAQLSAMRRGHKALTRGIPQVLRDNPAGPGALAYTMAHQGERLLVVLNTAAHPVLLDKLAVGAGAGSQWQGVFGLEGMPADLMADATGAITRELPALSGAVWRWRPAAVALGAASVHATTAVGAPPQWQEASPTAPVRMAQLEVAGQAAPGEALKLVLDGDLSRSQTVSADSLGNFTARLATDSLIDPKVSHRLVAYEPRTGQTSAPWVFSVSPQWWPVLDVVDPAGDDTGPQGRYQYPTDPGWGAHRQADIRSVRVWRAGQALQVEVGLNRVTRSWNPAHGFDHVALTLFFQLPGREGGERVMPLQNAELPGDMRWHLRLRAHGWSNALFSHEGASAQNEGRPLGQGAVLHTDVAAGTVRFTLPAAAWGGLASLSGMRLYINTWDYDAGYRALQALPGSHTFGGGNGSRDPLMMDDTVILVLP
jgi:glycosidase